MSTPDALERELDARLRVTCEVRHELYRLHLEDRMQEARRRAARYETLCLAAEALLETTVRPRMQSLAARFANAELLPPVEGDFLRCTCKFGHDAWFPATARFEWTAKVDIDCNRILLAYEVRILPIYFKIDPRGELPVDPATLDLGYVVRWIETSILRFLDLYLRLQQVDANQQENLVTDPVCGMLISKSSAASEYEHRGRPYYFCLDECRRKFVENPQQYLKVSDRC